MTQPSREHEGPTSRDCPECERLHDGPPEPLREGLDVERLRTAMGPRKHRRTLRYPNGDESGFIEEYRPATPEEVAREYAALSEPGDKP